MFTSATHLKLPIPAIRVSGAVSGRTVAERPTQFPGFGAAPQLGFSSALSHDATAGWPRCGLEALVASSVLVTTSKALVTRSDALVTNSFRDHDEIARDWESDDVGH